MRKLDTIRAGELRSRVTFKIRPDETTTDSAGGVQVQNSATDYDTWETRATVWGKIELNRGIESAYGLPQEGKRDMSLLYETLTIRYSPSTLPNNADAVLCDGKVYDIQSVGDINKHKRLVEITLREAK